MVAVSSTFFSVEVSFIKGNNNKGKWLLVEEKKRKIAGTVEFVCLLKKMRKREEAEREKREGKRERKRKGKEVIRGKGKPERE